MRNADNEQKKVDVFVWFFSLLLGFFSSTSCLLLSCCSVCILPFLSSLNISFNFHVVFFTWLFLYLFPTYGNTLSPFWVFILFSCVVTAMYVVLLWAISVMSLCMWVLSHAFVSFINDGVYCTNRIHLDVGSLSSSASLCWCLSAFVFFWFTICRSPQHCSHICICLFLCIAGIFISILP